jgi:hypothetical protein
MNKKLKHYDQYISHHLYTSTWDLVNEHWFVDNRPKTVSMLLNQLRSSFFVEK